ncbi:hypothetical protein [Streptococcus danieliae]|uniref:hypothetical protein n=1 Tax=Streptococcus danieliae TaxID=747656 RepID=UPI0021C6A207|nr:hypothetical protein [Streptococcus danieliae]MCU0082480.1 hypothetical protein [Streptococcus danieliae]
MDWKTVHEFNLYDKPLDDYEIGILFGYSERGAADKRRLFNKLQGMKRYVIGDGRRISPEGFKALIEYMKTESFLKEMRRIERERMKKKAS